MYEIFMKIIWDCVTAHKMLRFCVFIYQTGGYNYTVCKQEGAVMLESTFLSGYELHLTPWGSASQNNWNKEHSIECKKLV